MENIATMLPQRQTVMGLVFLVLVLIQHGGGPFVVVGFAYAPNFITKIVSQSIEANPTLKQPQPIDEEPAAMEKSVPRPIATATLGTEEEEEEETQESKDRPPSKTEARTETGVVTTRFPPEPNGYLHLGHAKAVSFNAAVADMYNGHFHMRLDDTNPTKEDEEYVESILEDVRWLLPSTSSSPVDPWYGPVRKTSDYFDLIYDCAMALVQSGDAYVDSLTAEEMREYRGTLTDPGKESPYRNRSVEENVKLFTAMRNGEYPEGAHVLRAKIDMSSPNLNMRDPALYRIKHESHQATGDDWCIYPMYDFSHPIADAVEGITHSLCSLEFEDHRPLYDWTLEKLMPTGLIDAKRDAADVGKVSPRQIEFSRLNLKYTVLSKRKLIQLVENGHVMGWDDPRMPTLSGTRRRGVPPSAIRLFCERVGISKSDSNIDYGVLEDCTREVMDKVCARAFAVLKPLKITLTNWGGSALEDFEVPRHPKDDSMGERVVPFGKHLYIERSDFFDTDGEEGLATGKKPPKGFKRLIPGGMVRLKYAYVITCDSVIRDPETKEPLELLCSVHPETRGGQPLQQKEDGKKPPRPGIIHWVEQSTASRCTINLYDRLFKSEEPGKSEGQNSVMEEGDPALENVVPATTEEPSFLGDLNPNSLDVLTDCFVEPSVAMDAMQLMAEIRRQHQTEDAMKGERIYYSMLSYQFERNGYFSLDPTSDTDHLVFNRVVTLRDTWAAPAASTGTASSKQKKRNRGSGSDPRGKNAKQPAGPRDDIQRVALTAATILSVEPHPEADSLIVCKVDCGDEDGAPRTVVAKMSVDTAAVGERVVCMTNLKPSKMRGIESTAMLLVAARTDEEMELLILDKKVPNGELLQFEECGESQPDAMLKSKGALKVWDRVKSALGTNDPGEVVYRKENGKECRLRSSQGPVVVTNSKNSKIQ